MAKKRGGKINVESLADAVIAELTDYDEYVSGTVLQEAILETAKETSEIVAENAPVRTGDYKKSITYGERLVRGRSQKVYYTTVYAESPEYRLTHLLENGHACRTGGRSDGKAKKTRVEGIPHWKQGTQNLQELFIKNFKSHL